MYALTRWFSVLLPALLLCACAGLLPAPTPMRSMQWSSAETTAKAPATCLVVFLPGLGDNAQDFERNGFVAEVERQELSVDMVAADATLGYYARGSFAQRLATDVIGPARARGYRQVWLVGMSMGGLGTVYYARAHTADITGIFALAPYLGKRGLIDEITEAGGLSRWHAPAKAQTLTKKNYQRELWRWLQAVTRGEERGPAIYLGYGSSDKLARANRLLAAELPDGHTFVNDGAHDWPTWSALLRQFLSSSALARDCRAAPPGPVLETAPTDERAITSPGSPAPGTATRG